MSCFKCGGFLKRVRGRFYKGFKVVRCVKCHTAYIYKNEYVEIPLNYSKTNNNNEKNQKKFKKIKELFN